MTKKIICCSLIFLILFNINSLAQNNKQQTKVLIATKYGDIKIALYNETPKHRDNFIKLVEEGTFNKTLFHRVIQTFMIQGGDPDSKNAPSGTALGNGGVGYTIPAEFSTNFIHKKGVLAAARQGDNVNPQKESSGCQFYIVQGKKYTREELDKVVNDKNAKRSTPVSYTEDQYKMYEEVGGTPHLDMDYTVFGEVIEGLEVIDKIAAVSTDPRNRPLENIEMTMSIIKDTRKQAIISTNMGDIKIVLYDETPFHRDNFLRLIKEGFYTSTLFHRVINEGMIQGGDPESKNAKKGTGLGFGDTGYIIPAERDPKLIHKRGALGAARTSNENLPFHQSTMNKSASKADYDAQVASNGSQFYIIQGKKYTQKELEKEAKKSGKTFTSEQYETYKTIGGVPKLDMEYTVFGEVVEGLEIVDKIAAVKTDGKDRPVNDVIITKIEIIE